MARYNFRKTELPYKPHESFAAFITKARNHVMGRAQRVKLRDKQGKLHEVTHAKAERLAFREGWTVVDRNVLPEYPCLVCKGSGRVMDPRTYDSYEGSKMASCYDCPACNGTGDGGRAALKAKYDEQMAKYRSDLAKARARRRQEMTLIQKIKAHFSPEEVDLMSEILD